MKGKKHPTRPQRVLRRGLLFALGLAFTLSFHVVRLTPMQSIRATEWHLGLAPTEIVLEKDDLYLSASEDVLMLTRHTPTLTSYYQPPACLLDRSHGERAAAGGICITDTAAGTMTLHLVGGVFSEEVHSLRAYHKIQDRPEEYFPELLPSQGESRYFWTVIRAPLEDRLDAPSYLDVLDAQGNVLETHLIPWTLENVQIILD